MKKFWSGLFVMLLSMALLVAGCGKELTAKEVLDKAITASSSMKSYDFETKMQLNFTAPSSLLEQEPEAAMVLEMLRNAELTVNGVYQEDPMQVEMTLNLALKGDFAMSFSMPFIMTEEKFWLKVPNIPMMNAFIPAELHGKYIELDMAELSEIDEQLASMNAAVDLELQKKLGLDMFQVISDNFADQDHLALLKAKDVTLPENVEATDVVKFTITNDNLEAALKIFINQVMPGMIDVLAKEEYAEMFPFEADELKEMKEQFTISDDDLKSALDEMAEALKINELSITAALDKDYNIPYNEFKVDVDVSAEGETFNIALLVQSMLTNINQSVEFKLGIPSEDETLTMADVEELIGGWMDDSYGFDEEMNWDEDWSEDDFDWMLDEEINWDELDPELLKELEELFSPEEWEQLMNELEAAGAFES